ncbi:DUF6308 family protein [Jiangella rhizosphaerae]|uniref:DUF6308 family protein n=1 Tax=Jiangella rhizosphaerae TaxID=2293569 RepID=UPI0011C47694|nr:DUF6308 family protein [Jiangella rhizosphaerae]
MTPTRARRPSPAQLDHARSAALGALENPAAVENLRLFYDRDSNYAGRSFLAVGPVEYDSITAADLYATSLLGISVGPRAGRQLLQGGPHRSDVLKALRAVPVDTDLADADDAVFDAAEHLHLQLKNALGGNKWVAASKLCARKRPRLFPVRDSLVTRGLLGVGQDRRVDWLVYQHLITDGEVQARLKEVTQESAIRESDLLDPPLRILDVVLWMHVKTAAA